MAKKKVVEVMDGHTLWGIATEAKKKSEKAHQENVDRVWVKALKLCIKSAEQGKFERIFTEDADYEVGNSELFLHCQYSTLSMIEEAANATDGFNVVSNAVPRGGYDSSSLRSITISWDTK